MNIEITDMDIVDINIKVAEQCLIKASVEDDDNRKMKSLLFAKKSIDSALISYGININDLKIMQGSPSEKTNRKFKSVVKATSFN